MLRHSFHKSEYDNYKPPEFIGRFPLGFVSVIASKPGIGKTWYTLYNIISYSKNFRVSGLFGDCSPILIYDRLRRIVNKPNSDNIFCYFLSEIQQSGFIFDLSQEKGINGIKKLIVDNNIQLLFIDTLISFISSDESSQKEITPIMQKLVNIASSTNCAIVINHHLRKQDVNAKSATIDDVIGSSVITRLAAVVLILSKHNGMINISTVKNWFCEVRDGAFHITNTNGAITLSEAYQIGSNTQSKSEIVIEYIKNLSADSIFCLSQLEGLLISVGATTVRKLYHDIIEMGLAEDLSPDAPIMDKMLKRCKEVQA